MDRIAGPFFGNDVMTLRLDGRRADLLLEQAGPVPTRDDRRRTARAHPAQAVLSPWVDAGHPPATDRP